MMESRQPVNFMSGSNCLDKDKQDKSDNLINLRKMYGRVFWGVRCIVFVWQVRSVHFSGRFNKRLATNGILQGFRRNPASRVPTRLTPRQRNNHSQCTFTHLGRRRRIIQSFRRTLIAGWNKWRVSFITSAHLCLLQSSISKGGETCRPSRFVSSLLILHKWKSPPPLMGLAATTGVLLHYRKMKETTLLT